MNRLEEIAQKLDARGIKPPKELVIVTGPDMLADDIGMYFPGKPIEIVHPLPSFTEGARILQNLPAEQVPADKKQGVNTAFGEFLSNTERLQDKEFAAAFSSNDSQLAITLQKSALGAPLSASYRLNSTDHKHRITYPADAPNELQVGDFKSNLFTHEAAHYLDQYSDKGRTHLHSASALFRLCFEYDLQQNPDGAAQLVKRITDTRYHDNTNRDQKYREYFANTVELFLGDDPALTERFRGSPLEQYMQIVKRQIQECAAHPTFLPESNPEIAAMYSRLVEHHNSAEAMLNRMQSGYGTQGIQDYIANETTAVASETSGPPLQQPRRWELVVRQRLMPPATTRQLP